MSDSADRDSRFEEVLASCLRAADEGRLLDRASVLESNPDLASDLEKFFEGQDWIRGAIEAASQAPDQGPLPRRFGKYELLEVIGRGGMGVVFKAAEAGRTVALKMILASQVASPESVYRFRSEARRAAELDHPNIIPIYDVGEHEDQHYFTMKLLDGGTLEDRIPELRNRPRGAAHLMEAVARAVRHAHQRGILHRDLKPGNILLDQEGRPYVADFGLAIRLEGTSRLTRSGSILGSVPYMAPEQLSGDRKRLSVRSDVWSLGAILYELLTGRLPFPGENHGEIMTGILDPVRAPENPRTLNPLVSRDLATICLTCLEKDPARRYDNAARLAEDLESWLDGKPISKRPAGPLERLVLWCRRKPGAAALAGLSAVLLVILAGAFERERRHRAFAEGRRQEILLTNAAMAQDIAERFRMQLREWGARIEQAARDPEASRLLAAQDFAGLQAYFERIPFDPAELESRTILDASGTMRARVPDNDNRKGGRNFSDRDYFKGPLGHLERSLTGAHASRAFRTSHEESYNIAVSAAFQRDGALLGVYRVSLSTGTTLGLAHLHDARRRVVVVAPWETSYPQDESDKVAGFRVILHPLLAQGQKPVPIRHTHLDALSRHSCQSELAPPLSGKPALHEAGYRDPIDGGSWLAGFAPIGNTGYVVIVQQREE